MIIFHEKFVHKCFILIELMSECFVTLNVYLSFRIILNLKYFQMFRFSIFSRVYSFTKILETKIKKIVIKGNRNVYKTFNIMSILYSAIKRNLLISVVNLHRRTDNGDNIFFLIKETLLKAYFWP